MDDAVGQGVGGVDLRRARLVGVAHDGGRGNLLKHRLRNGRQGAGDGRWALDGVGVLSLLDEGDLVGSRVFRALIVGRCAGDFAVAGFVVDSFHPGRGNGRCGAGVGGAVAAGVGEVVVGVRGFWVRC